MCVTTASACWLLMITSERVTLPVAPGSVCTLCALHVQPNGTGRSLHVGMCRADVHREVSYVAGVLCYSVACSQLRAAVCTGCALSYRCCALALYIVPLVECLLAGVTAVHHCIPKNMYTSCMLSYSATGTWPWPRVDLSPGLEL
jgi:hypothetical protein